MSVSSWSGSRRKTTILRRKTLEETLLNREERAALDALDSSLNSEGDNEPVRYRLGRCIGVFCCNRATFALLTTFFILLVGGSLFIVTTTGRISDTISNSTIETDLRIAGGFLVSAGIFGLLGGLANLMALLMLFYEVPLVYGTGVIQRRHRQIGNIICRIVVNMLFDSEHLKNYILERISKYSVDINIMESIASGLKSSKADVIINSHLDDLYSQSESQYLIAVGVTRSRLTPMIRPAILSLCAETAPFVLTHDTEEHTVSIPKLRDAITGFLLHRVQTLSKTMVSNLMRQLLFQHLIGLIMYGCIMGCLVGLLAQGVRFTINPQLGV